MTKIVDFRTRGPQERWIVLHTRDKVPSDRLQTRFAIADSKAEVFDLVLEMAGAGKWDVEKWECLRRERGEDKPLRYPDMDHDELIYELRQLGAIGDDQFEAVHYEAYERRRSAYPETMESYQPEARNDNAAGAAPTRSTKTLEVDYEEMLKLSWEREKEYIERLRREYGFRPRKYMSPGILGHFIELKRVATKMGGSAAIGMATSGIVGVASRLFM